VVTNACAFYHRARGCGCIERPAFPAPSDFRGRCFAGLGQNRAAGMLSHVSHRHCEERKRRSNPERLRGGISGLLRFRLRSSSYGGHVSLAMTACCLKVVNLGKDGAYFVAPVRLRQEASPDTLHPDGLCGGCATRSPSARSVVPGGGLSPHHEQRSNINDLKTLSRHRLYPLDVPMSTRSQIADQREAPGLSRLSSGAVDAARFHPWQARVIVVDACASRA
jgi:hypothetical protein